MSGSEAGCLSIITGLEEEEEVSPAPVRGSNIGITGPDSLRLGGMKVDELPFAAAEQTKHQLPEFYATEKLNKIARIKARFPKQSVDWCNGAIRECEGNMVNVRGLKAQAAGQIEEYKALISQCKRRDRKIDEAESQGKTEDEIRVIKKGFPLYQVKPMKHQIGQFRATINRCDDVIEKEKQSIKEVRDLRTACAERDRLLKELDTH